jgi:methylmalonyl-CoA mutase
VSPRAERSAQPENLTLAGDFPAASVDDWRARVAKVADGPLTTDTYDGFAIEPLYDPAPVRTLAAAEPWWLLQRVDAPGQALPELEGGASGLWVRVEAGQLEKTLDGVLLDIAPVVLDANYEAAERLLRLGAVSGNLGADPLGRSARTGTTQPFEPAVELAGRAGTMRTFVADALPYHEAGCSDGEELGAAVATAVAYLRALTDSGIPVDKAAAQLDFRLAATADQFATIAKLRALRLLWARVGQVSDFTEPARIHAVTSWSMLTKRDPWVNILRATVGCFAASAGGADAITVLPFDTAIGRSDEFAHRLARNTASLIRDEANAARAADPGAGSGYVEALTDSLARAGWAFFREIERNGGMASALADGFVTHRIASTRNRRLKRLATRKDPITGVSAYPLLDERPVTRKPGPATVHGGLPRFRYAEPFEELRDRADAAPERPTVHLTAGAERFTSMWHAGGFATVTDAAGARIACVSGNDDVEAERVWQITDDSDALEILREALEFLGVP